MVHIYRLPLPLTNLMLKDEYSNLIPPFLHSCLEGKDPFELESPVFGIGAEKNGVPIGVILATAHTKAHTAQIHIVTLKSGHYSQAITASLLEKLTNLFLSQGIKLATIQYIKEDPFSSILEQVFIEHQWEGPRPLLIECLFKRENFNPDWWHLEIPMKEGFEISLFKKLSPKDLKDLHHRYQQETIPGFIFPLEREKKIIEYKNSLILRYQGKVIGWMITHRILPSIIRYTALYLEEDYNYTRYWLKLLIEALYIHRQIPGADYGLLEINLDQISKPWLKFIERRLFPQASTITHKFIFWKKFS